MFRLSVALGCACFSLLTASAAAEEQYPRYIYNADGSYQRAADDRTGGEGVANIGIFTAYDDVDNLTWGIRGSLASSVTNLFVAQFDAEYASASTNALGATLHASRRFRESTILGIFGHASQAGLSEVTPITTTLFGAQAGYQGEVFSVQAGAGFGTSGTTVADDEIAALFLNARVYLNDNFAVTGFLRSQAIDLDFGNTGFAEAALRADYRFDASPISLYAEAAYREYYSPLAGVALDSSVGGLVGLKYHFSSQSLRDEERNGLFWRR